KTANSISSDFDSSFKIPSSTYLSNAIKAALLECVSEEQLTDPSFNALNTNGDDINFPDPNLKTLLSNKDFRELLCDLSEKNPKISILSKIVSQISYLGYQREVATINSASIYSNVFFEMLSQTIKKLKNADDGNISQEINELWQLVGYREHTYFMAQYLLQEACTKAGENGYPYQRIIEELEGRVYKQFERPLVATHIQILLESLPIDGKHPLSLSLISILQSGRAAPGDVVTLYKAYHDSPTPPPAKIIRNTDITELLLKEVFSFYNDDEDSGSLVESLEDKYLWLVAYAALTVDSASPSSSIDRIEYLSNSKNEINMLVSTLKQLKRKLIPITTMLDFNKMISWLLETIKTPIAALLVTEWIRSILSANNFNYYEAYFRSSEVPIPLLLLEEVAFLQPQLRPLVFSVYVESFQSRVESFLPEIRVLEMIEAPYSSELSMLLLQLIARVLKALLDTPSIHDTLRSFLISTSQNYERDVIGELDPVAIEASTLLLRSLK
ncbi:Negative elongation factor D, partial [Smittium culicis]